MRILDVEVIGFVPDDVREGLARRVADRAGDALDSKPQGTWAKLRFLDEDAYAENGGGPPASAKPVLVSLFQAEPPQGEQLAQLASRLTVAIASACDRPAENVHIIFEPAGLGCVSFGGKLRL